MSRNLVLTIAIGHDWQRLAEVTHPRIQAYAEKVGADFAVIGENDTDKAPHWLKLHIGKLLARQYDRVLYLDTDCVVRDDCPDLFAAVPEDRFAAFNEGMFLPRMDVMQEGLKRYVSGGIIWDSRYFNTGVFLAGRQHRVLFRDPADWSDDLMWEQTYINVALAAHNIDAFDLPYRVNYMPSLQWKTGEPVENAFIVHLADIHPAIAREHALNVIKNWTEAAPDYKFPRRLWMDFGGGLGDVIDAEPVLRYAQRIVFPGDEIRVTSPWARVFQGTYPDLNLSFGPESPWGDVPCFKMMAVDETLTTRRPITHVASTACDFASINMLNLQLPACDRQIRLSIFDADRQEIDELAEDFPLESAALIHAGRTWASRTFPVEWWQEVIDKVAAKMPVVLMGKQGEIHGVLPVEAGKNVLDLRDRTTMGAMFELVRRCPVLLTNDSSPVHVAGAFDNSIVLIPSARHPDLVLPWRGSPHPHPYYKAVALFKKLTIDEVDRSPCNPVGSHADGPPKGDWSEYLPEVFDVVKAVLSGAKDTT